MRRLTITLTLISALHPVQAASGFNEQSLKALFTTPGERQALNAERRGGQASSGDEIITGPASIQVNGIVSRSDGKSVVWMNGRNTMDNSMIDGVKVYSNAMKKRNSKIPVMVDGRMVYLKPGETWSEESGVVDETQ